MNKVFLVGIMLTVMLIFSGCSMKSENNLDKATKQKNITKIQNDVNEVMGKSYNYVIENIGEPYIIKYYSDKNDFNKLKNISKEDILKNLDIEFVYPKDSDEKSALYISISKGKVVSVETNELVDFNYEIENLNKETNNSNVVFIYYNNRNLLDFNKINFNYLKSYNGKNINETKKGCILTSPNAILYTKDNNRFTNYYIIEDNNKKTNTVLEMVYENGKILNIKHISSNIALKEFVNLKK